MEKYCNPL